MGSYCVYKKVFFLLSVILITFILSACNGGCLNLKETKKLLNNKLSIGNTRDQVKLALKNIDINFSYDRYQDQYYATIRDEHCNQYEAISVYLAFDESEKLGATIMEEVSHKAVAKLLNQSWTLVQTSDMWGGGQRATLEAMACGVPPVVMNDSPKNKQYIEDSEFGLICSPDAESIRNAVNLLKINPYYHRASKRGIAYVKSKWTAQKYADALLRVIEL